MTREEETERSKFSRTLAKMPKVKLPNPINKISKYLKQRSKVKNNLIYLKKVKFINCLRCIIF